MSDDEDTLWAARNKWVTVETVVEMIRAVAPPHIDAVGWTKATLEAGRKSGELQFRRVKGTDGYYIGQCEWNLQSLIIKLLAIRKTSWPGPIEPILRLATIELEDLPLLRFEQLTRSNGRNYTTSTIGAEQENTALPDEVKSKNMNATNNSNDSDINGQSDKQIKSKGRPSDPLWAQVLGYAAGWLAYSSDRSPTQAILQKVIDERFGVISKYPPDTSTTRKYARQMLEAFKKFEEEK